jgi:hypothetical protein
MHVLSCKGKKPVVNIGNNLNYGVFYVNTGEEAVLGQNFGVNIGECCTKLEFSC